MTQPASLFSLRRDTLPPLKDARCERVFEALTQAGVEVEGEDRDFLETVFSAAPYLARLAMRRVDTLARLFTEDAGDVADALITALPEAGADAPDIASLGDRLRRAKADMHLVTALADLAGVWSLDEATSRLSAFADAAVQAGLHGLVREAAGRGRLNPPGDAANPLPGLFVLAMGKMGADELNYSSDIDLVIFYDRDMLEMPEGVDAERVLPRLVQRLVRLLQDPTSEGYVFRTDLRLRPDPGATPTAMQSEAALRYYESIGQNWERAAYIKARVCAGDVAAGQAFLTAMTPFIWRRSLDYAAVDDIRALARQIQSVGDRAQVRAAGHNVKLGRGGIREIEFFAQVPQLVFGGRQPALRVRSPVKALEKLAGEGKVPAAHAEALAADYAFLRRVEHRIQMLEDEATQTLPEDDTLRHRVGILCGFESLDRFDDTVRAVLTRVHATFSEQFSDDESLASDSGSLVFSGVEPTPDTLTTLATLGFSEPASIWNRVNAWLGGRTRATRTQRARELLTRLAPSLLDAMAETGEPDAAFSRFAAFYENLPMGVQPLSLLRNEPELSRELVAILGLAPRIAATLAQRPAILDVMLDARFSRPLSQDPVDDLRTRFLEQMAVSENVEDAMNRARRLAREERFRIGSQILVGRADARAAGATFAELAEASIHAMARAAHVRMEERHGPMPGHYVILGLGKLGGRELASDSDLDLMLVYESTGEGAETWFTRFTQRFVSALSAPTEEGELFEVDLQLRPSGKAGPVAVSLPSFLSYYASEAWTWERMALTRARIVCGDAELSAQIEDGIEGALSQARNSDIVREDAAAMRARLEQEKPGRGRWDIKRKPGGLVDIEFIAQTLQLIELANGNGPRETSTVAALERLQRDGALDDEAAGTLTSAARLYLDLLQLVRTAHGSGFDPSQAAKGFSDRLVRTAGAESIEGLAERLDTASVQVRQQFEALIHPLS
ncbi:MAG: bifunctional [glutamate--ammonia ligase]-adenylyl-L-tyrosine phosphorylase/[glutamate--ammonia-ligase] adenylyltransferase [Maricaulis sp.]|jgi:glutamate-ammonia-ligase adenylyltransferase|nr:bifunctional [glutamate--ammonia ligase]-adenylyl-L-tyrosine phosphorylase/[glutamate--ammonia-ligase] adenylyltransferase [Maricaulis sp.]